MTFYFIAIIVYGVLANIAALVLSSQTGSPVATALVFVSTGLTYLFQVCQAQEVRRSGLLMLGAIAALLLSVLASLWSLL